MAEWAAKRFWDRAEAVAEGDHYTVHLDGRPVKTPGKKPLIVPNQAFADAIAAEWNAQGEEIDPAKMPMTRAANTAIERVAPQRDAVIENLAEYAETDLVCYLAAEPETLVIRQATAWGPLRDWAKMELKMPLTPCEGVMHQPQDSAVKAQMRALLEAYSDYALVGVHDMITLTGSAVIGMAVAQEWLTVEDAWARSRIDEEWNAEVWGRDEEADSLAAHKLEEFRLADRILRISR